VPEKTGYWNMSQHSPIRKLQDKLYTAYKAGVFRGKTFPQHPLVISSFHPSDGIYGPGTINAVIDFQTVDDLVVDASVGLTTWTFLGGC
jgi:peptidoglycan hydrolase-like protein with peptidoglycan-binding domain